MSEDLEIVWQQGDEGAETTPGRRLRAAISDAFAFIRSAEANQAFATVTLEELMNDQINRNGDSDRSNAAQYDPYSYDPEKVEPSSAEPAERANFLGGADTGRPTKLDRVLALVNSIEDIVKQIKDKEPVDVADPEEYTGKLETAIADPGDDTGHYEQ